MSMSSVRLLTLCATISATSLSFAADKLVLQTTWVAQAEQGGYYQAVAAGIYKKYGLDVEVRSGGPQLNNMTLLGVMTDKRWQATRNFMVSAGLLNKDTDYKAAYTTQFYPQAAM